jgi:hypothetical protein
MVRLPTWGLVQEASLEGVVVPLAQVNELNAAGSAWESRALKTLRQAAKQGLVILKDQQEPDQPLEDAEFGLRLAATFSGWDLALIGFHGFVDSPVLRRQAAVNGAGDEIFQLTPVHPRFWAVGVNFAKGLDRSTIRGELALKPDMPMTLADDASIPGYERRALLEGVLGWDRTFGLNLYLNLQYFYAWVCDPEGLSQDEFTHGLTCDLHDMFMEDALEAGVRGTVSFSDQGWVGELYAEYTPVDDWLFTASLMVFEGPESGQYGQYDQNDSLTLSLRYSF